MEKHTYRATIRIVKDGLDCRYLVGKVCETEREAIRDAARIYLEDEQNA